MKFQESKKTEFSFIHFLFLSFFAHGFFFLILSFFSLWSPPFDKNSSSPLSLDFIMPLQESFSIQEEVKNSGTVTGEKESKSSLSSEVPHIKKVSDTLKKELPAKPSVKRALTSQQKRPPMEKSNRAMIDSALKKMAAEVEKKGASGKGEALPSSEEDRKPVEKTGPAGSYRNIESLRAIDLYRSQLAYKVQQNWVYSGSEKTVKGAVLVFYVTREGRVKDLVLKQSSGNRRVDESAMRAVLKSEPFSKIPESIEESTLGIGLRFTDKGVGL